MPTGENREQEDRRQQDEALRAPIRQQVLDALGAPLGPGRVRLGRVEVRSLWDSHYRVNVVAGDDLSTTRIVSSYFVQTDGDGLIVRSTPAIAERGG